MPDLTPVARRLRRDQTDVERRLWSRLRSRRMAGWKFRRQMPVGRFVVDFCCPDAWLIVELDGGQHSRDNEAERDRMRSAELEVAGYLVARFWNGEVVENLDGVCDTILNLLQGAPSDLDGVVPPHPDPLPLGERERVEPVPDGVTGRAMFPLPEEKRVRGNAR